MKPKVFNLNKTVANINKMLARLIGENIEIFAKLDSELGQISADPGQIEQVMVNLVVNARDAMPNGGKLTIETSNVSIDDEYSKQHHLIKPGNFVLLSIVDTGIGMDKTTLSKIFEPFFTTKETGRGTGLGLAAVDGIVKQSGGEICVYSEPGRGSTFEIYLPRVFRDVDPTISTNFSEIEPRGNATILLVEDDELVSNLTFTVLEENGYHVLNAESGEEAMEICKETRGNIDLLLTDLIMPNMGGIEVADHVQKLKPAIKILFISGYTQNAIVDNHVLEAEISFLEKPFSPTGLLRKVREVLEKE
jgi:CheY-like chemotaxis protein